MCACNSRSLAEWCDEKQPIESKRNFMIEAKDDTVSFAHENWKSLQIIRVDL